MKRALILPLAVVATVLASPAAHAAGTYVNLGDSVAAGVGAPSPDQGASGIFYSWLQTAEGGGADVWANLAGNGGNYGPQDSATFRSSGQLAAGIAAIDDPSDTIAVTLTIGGNDSSNPNCGVGKWNTGTCPYKANLAGILDDLQAALGRDPGAEKLIVTLYYNPDAGQNNAGEASYDTGLLGTDRRIDCAGTGGQQGLDDIIDCTALAHGAVPADAYSPSKRIGQGFMASDGVHPSPTGHQAIAEAWRDAYLGRVAGPIVVPGKAPAPFADKVAALLGIPATGSRLKVSRTGYVTIGKPSMCPPVCGHIEGVGRVAGRTVLRVRGGDTSGRQPALRGRLTAAARRTLAHRGRLTVTMRFTGTAALTPPQSYAFTRRYVLRRS